RDPQRLLGHLDEATPLSTDRADRDGDRRVGAPAVQLAGGVDLEQVALLENALTGDAVNDLLVERQTGHGGEGHLAGIALEQRQRPVASEERLDSLIDLNRL